ncbi:MAG: tetratricopeptide (TPR) repeat protein [Rhodothermales bacterium]|jgi:tetratricopeptide (TPR) repeat protein
MRRFSLALTLLPVTTLTALLSPDALAQTGEDLLQQAVRTERLSGNLDAAIALYEQIVEQYAGDRDLSSQALLQLARAYESLGRTEARKAYGPLLND